jgi:hypothetical protein
MSRLLALAFAILFAASGCRMCACPYDYCGPVPGCGCGDDCGGGGCSSCGGGGYNAGPYGGGGMMYEGANVGPQQGRMVSNGGNYNNNRMAYNNSYNGRASYSNGMSYGSYANGNYNNQPMMNRSYNGPQMANSAPPMNGAPMNSVVMNGQQMNGQRMGPAPQPTPSYAMRPSRPAMYSTAMGPNNSGQNYQPGQNYQRY